MKWIKCVYNGGFETLTVGKIYKVLGHTHHSSTKHTIVSDRVCIINDLGQRDSLSLITSDGDAITKVWFEDATDEVRDKKLNEILD